MTIKETAKAELESRVRRIEDFIAERGVGSAQLARVKRVQRNINLAIVLGGIVTVAGLTALALHSLSKPKDD